MEEGEEKVKMYKGAVGNECGKSYWPLEESNHLPFAKGGTVLTSDKPISMHKRERKGVITNHHRHFDNSIKTIGLNLWGTKTKWEVS